MGAQTGQQLLRQDGMLVRKGQQQLDNRGEAHLLKELSPSGRDPHPCSTGEEMQAQRRWFIHPRSHSKDTTGAWMEAAPNPVFWI